VVVCKLWEVDINVWDKFLPLCCTLKKYGEMWHIQLLLHLISRGRRIHFSVQFLFHVLYQNLLLFRDFWNLSMLGFFCGLFYDTTNISDIKWWNDLWLMNWKKFGRKQSLPKCSTILALLLAWILYANSKSIQNWKAIIHRTHLQRVYVSNKIRSEFMIHSSYNSSKSDLPLKC
jgi:hypothetical protein